MWRKISILLLVVLVYPNLLLAQVSYNISVSALVLANSVNPFPTENQNNGVVLTELPTILMLSGYTSPNSRVSVYINETIISETFSDQTGEFGVTLNTLRPGSYNLGIRSIDAGNFPSRTYSMQLILLAKKITNIENIFLSPSLSVIGNSKSFVMIGSTAPFADVYVSFLGQENRNLYTKSDQSGNYSFPIDNKFKIYINKQINTIAYLDTQKIMSDISLPVTISSNFFENAPETETDTQVKGGVCFSYADLNYDCLANVIDFNILHYWFRKKISPPTIDLNKDGEISISDFSILAHYWN